MRTELGKFPQQFFREVVGEGAEKGYKEEKYYLGLIGIFVSNSLIF